jgi:hypothetical protein
MVDREKLDLERSTPGPARLVQAGMHDETADPGIEPVGVTKGRQIPPGTDEGVLDGVLRTFGIAEDQPSDRVQSTDRGACQDREGVMIATLRLLHEIALHVPLGISMGPAPMAVLARYGTAVR